MSRSKVRIDAVPEAVQAVVIQAANDLVERRGLDPETVAVTRLERLERLASENEQPLDGGLTLDAPPDYRIYFLAKGTQYIYETRRGKSPRLTAEQFVV